MRATTIPRIATAVAALILLGACSDTSGPALTGGSGSGGGSTQTLTVVPSSATINAGQVLALRARLIDEFGDSMDQAVSWRSSNDAVATVASTGEVYGRSEGRVVITATASGKSQTSAIRVLGRVGKPDPHPDPI